MKTWKVVGLGVGCLLLGMGIALWVLSYPSATREKATVASTAESPIDVLHKECDQLEIYRESNQELIRPFLLMDEECESPSLAILKEKIIQKINLLLRLNHQVIQRTYIFDCLKCSLLKPCFP